VARDIASVADKDTRDDVETRGEPLPLHDGPRSEGGPPTGGSGADVTGPPRVELPLNDTEPAVPVEEPEADPALAAAAETALEPAPTAAETEPEVGPIAEAPPAPDTWHTAIADALAPQQPEPDLPASNAPFIRWIDHEAAPLAHPVHEPASEPEPAPPPVFEPEPLQSVAVEAPPTAIDAPASAPAPSHVEPDPAAFTAAAEGLFRPADAREDTHLITIGRRLDPSLRVHRPVAPDITPRTDTYDDHPPEITWKNGTWKDRAWIAARYAAYALGGYLALVAVLILLFRFVDPPGSMLMLRQLLTGTAIDRTWKPLSSISPALVRAVIVSEDGRFCEHSGIDTAAIREAIERASGGVPRGASTISMQVTKNLFLWNAKSYIRKVIEIPLTLIMELVWPKWRILEVYLNIAEWGPGVFGAEAAAQHHFHKPASRLSDREAALLAAVLPNPVVRDAGSPGPGTSAKARVVQSRVRAYGAVASCVVSASAPPPAPAAAKPVRKPTPLRRPPPQRKQQDDWAPTLNFTP
jgi:monofunctional biosynthetic peptidoglycan transglycosylase